MREFEKTFMCFAASMGDAFSLTNQHKEEVATTTTLAVSFVIAVAFVAAPAATFVAAVAFVAFVAAV